MAFPDESKATMVWLPFTRSASGNWSFEWADEWWKLSSGSPSVQETTSTWTQPGYFDEQMHEARRPPPDRTDRAGRCKACAARQRAAHTHSSMAVGKAASGESA